MQRETWSVQEKYVGKHGADTASGGEGQGTSNEDEIAQGSLHLSDSAGKPFAKAPVTDKDVNATVMNRSALFGTDQLEQFTAQTDKRLQFLVDTVDDTSNGVNRLLALVERVMENNRRLEVSVAGLREEMQHLIRARQSSLEESSIQSDNEGEKKAAASHRRRTKHRGKLLAKKAKLNTFKARSAYSQILTIDAKNRSAVSPGDSESSHEISVQTLQQDTPTNTVNNSVTLKRRLPVRLCTAKTTPIVPELCTKRKNIVSLEASSEEPRSVRGKPIKNERTVTGDAGCDNVVYKHKIGFANISTERMCTLALHGDASTGYLKLNELLKVPDKVDTIARFNIYCRAGDLFQELMKLGYNEKQAQKAVTIYVDNTWGSSWYRLVNWMRMNQDKFDSVVSAIEEIAEGRS